MNGSFVNSLFYEEPVGTFADGYVFKSTPDLTSAQQDPSNGYWRCDIADNNKLTWSKTVYELFGLPAGSSITRDLALARYSGESRKALERVRTFGLRRDFGFILDAQINSQEEDARWIRILSVPIVAEGRVVALHGLKRAVP